MTRARRAPPARHLALLRGVDVGGRHALPMRDLVELFVEAGCRDVRTHIQGGNVLFTADPHAVEPLPGLIAARIAERFGNRVPVVLRTADELARRVPVLALYPSEIAWGDASGAGEAWRAARLGRGAAQRLRVRSALSARNAP